MTRDQIKVSVEEIRRVKISKEGNVIPENGARIPKSRRRVPLSELEQGGGVWRLLSENGSIGVFDAQTKRLVSDKEYLERIDKAKDDFLFFCAFGTETPLYWADGKIAGSNIYTDYYNQLHGVSQTLLRLAHEARLLRTAKAAQNEIERLLKKEVTIPVAKEEKNKKQD